MRRTLLMIAAVALLLTQCRKPAVELPTAGPANENMVSMTVTVGHGGKTDINGTTGAIKWSKGDKLYVGNGSKYIGCLTLVGDGGSATGTFSGTVTADAGTYTFGFYYLGSGDYTSSLESDPTSVDIPFGTQTGLRENLSDCHIGYGTASGKVKDENVILDSTDPVTMTSKVAIAYFEFKDGETPYTGAIKLIGTNIYNKMTVKFSGAESGMFTGKDKGGINLTNTSSSKKYVMLVPTGTGEETLNFGNDDMIGTTKLYKGIEANKFYCLGEGKPIEVTVKPIEFSVADDTKVEFSPGNLYWDGSVFRFEENQWDFRHYKGKTNDEAVIGGVSQTTPSGTVGSFFWSKDAAEAIKETFNLDPSVSLEDVFFTNSTETTANPDFQVNGETAGTWRTLSKAEWDYLLDSRANASSLRAWVTLTDVSVSGLVILPDGTENPSTVLSSITSTDALATYGAVFLPAAGIIDSAGVHDVGSRGNYWSSTPNGDLNFLAYGMSFSSEFVGTDIGFRDYGYAVRLVR